MNIKQMAATADKVADLMKMLSNKHRLMILCQLVESEKSVGQLAKLLGVREPAMSQQLATLRREGLIRPRREAQTIKYALARDDVRRLIGFLYDTYCRDTVPEGGRS